MVSCRLVLLDVGGLTMVHLGLDFEDMSAAEDLYAAYQSSLVFPKMETFAVSQENGGLGGTYPISMPVSRIFSLIKGYRNTGIC